MSLQPILDAGWLIQTHIAFAAVALAFGPLALFRRRRDIWHKGFGYVWVGAMVGLALSGFAIPSGNPILFHMGPIHIFTFMALHGIWSGVRHARAGHIIAHQMAMRSLWFGAIGIAGLLTLMPGRTLNRVIFGESSQIGWVLIALGLIGLWLLWRRRESPIPRLS